MMAEEDFIHGKEITFIDNPDDDEHRPHHIFRCSVAPDGLQCLAKENSHSEGEKLRFFHRTLLHLIMPAFYGVYARAGTDLSYAIIEDMDRGFAAPCRCDIKLGTRQWDCCASDEFRIKLIRKNEESISGTMGFRLVSMTLAHRGRVCIDTSKSQNCYLTREQFETCMRAFLPGCALMSVIRQVQNAANVFRQFQSANKGFRVYSGSLLITYDGDNMSQDPRVALIDFAHAHIDINNVGGDSSDPAFDDGVVFGLENLLGILRSFVPDPDDDDLFTFS